MINIMFTGNDKVYDGMLIASISIVKHCKEPITCFVITMDLTDRNPNFRPVNNTQISQLKILYQSVNPSSQVVLVDATDLFLKELGNSPNNHNAYTPYSLLRLLTHKIDVIPDKALYLDTDIIFNDNITKLYDTNITNYELAGVRDYYGKFFFYPQVRNLLYVCR